MNPTEKLCDFIDTILKSFVNKCANIIKDLQNPLEMCKYIYLFRVIFIPFTQTSGKIIESALSAILSNANN